MEDPPPLSAQQAAAIEVVRAVIDESQPGVRVDAESGPCDEACAVALRRRSDADAVLLVRALVAIRRARVELALAQRPADALVVEGSPGDESFKASLREQLARLRPAEPAIALPSAPPPTAPEGHAVGAWALAGATFLVGAAGIGCGVAYAIDTGALQDQPIVTEEVRAIDARRQLSGPLALGFALAGLGLATLTALVWSEGP